MQIREKLKPNTLSCRNTTTKEPFIRIMMTKFSIETTTCPHPWKCRIKACSLKFYRKEWEISVKRDRASTPILQMKTPVTSTHSLDLTKVFYNSGKEEPPDIRVPMEKISD
jgi:hypothetical protein